LQKKLKNAVFIRVFNKLKSEGFYDDFAKTLKLEPKAPCRASAAKKTPSKTNGIKKSGVAVAQSLRLTAGN
jgi:hypothetical protein